MASEGAMPGRLTRWIASAELDWDAVYAEQLPRVYNFFAIGAATARTSKS
jgi:hypothetical protein